ncbi:nucleoside-diphosphate kinase [Streptococcus saliviloxodontae]|uniref:Nucleoside diphosphate kinase n=1 Tax=Streptococcus saliviloxodontae TaxID=1349416 RepID=A0ABS2PPM6_9STRE|nr:nucleoside-diphosphate kinase [Streptococcus saliviloxodontae]MBM7637066.1 nucleoside-diphosphate kinase [Streptococcus saliviloxodontae]
MEKTFFMIKPDGVERGLVGDVLKRIERRGFRLEKLEMRQIDRASLEKHYADLVDRPFFLGIAEFMMSAPVVMGVIAGPGVVASWRDMLGATNPAEAAPGTIRGDFATAPTGSIIPNIAHGSDSLESAQREIAIWFPEMN